MNPIIKALFDHSKRLGISNYRLSKLSGVSRSTLSRIEKGTLNPTLEMMHKIGKELGIKLKWEKE